MLVVCIRYGINFDDFPEFMAHQGMEFKMIGFDKCGEFSADQYQKDQHEYFTHNLVRASKEIETTNQGPTGIDRYGRSLLYWAVLAKDEEKVEELVRNGANPNIVSSYRTVLHEAAQYGTTPRILKLLADAGADFQVGNDKNVTPFQMLSPNTAPELIKLWVQLGSSINAQKDGYSLLHSWASSGGTAEGLQTLIDLGLPVDEPDKSFGITPLGYAIQNNYNSSLIDFFVQRGAVLNRKDNKGCPYFFCLETEIPGNTFSEELRRKRLERLLQNNFNINLQNAKGETLIMRVLHYAVTIDFSNTLLSLNPNLKLRTCEGLTAEDYLNNNRNLSDSEKHELFSLFVGKPYG